MRGQGDEWFRGVFFDKANGCAIGVWHFVRWMDLLTRVKRFLGEFRTKAGGCLIEAWVA